MPLISTRVLTAAALAAAVALLGLALWSWVDRPAPASARVDEHADVAAALTGGWPAERVGFRVTGGSCYSGSPSFECVLDTARPGGGFDGTIHYAVALDSRGCWTATAVRATPGTQAFVPGEALSGCRSESVR